MKEELNQLKHKLVGELQEFEDGVVTVIKKEDEDSINLNEFFEEVKIFVEANEGKNVDIQFILKAVE